MIKKNPITRILIWADQAVIYRLNGSQRVHPLTPKRYDTIMLIFTGISGEDSWYEAGRGSAYTEYARRNSVYEVEQIYEFIELLRTYVSIEAEYAWQKYLKSPERDWVNFAGDIVEILHHTPEFLTEILVRKLGEKR